MNTEPASDDSFRDVLEGCTALRLKELLRLTISNQQAEGHCLTPDEIDQCRQRLRERVKNLAKPKINS